MAKALLGGVGRIDHRMVAEMRRLQQRVHDLESQLVRLQMENDSLHAASTREITDEDILSLNSDKEPALA